MLLGVLESAAIASRHLEFHLGQSPAHVAPARIQPQHPLHRLVGVQSTAGQFGQQQAKLRQSFGIVGKELQVLLVAPLGIDPILSSSGVAHLVEEHARVPPHLIAVEQMDRPAEHNPGREDPGREPQI